MMLVLKDNCIPNRIWSKRIIECCSDFISVTVFISSHEKEDCSAQWHLSDI